MNVTKLIDGFLGSSAGRAVQEKLHSHGLPQGALSKGGLAGGLGGASFPKGAAAGGLAALMLGTKKGRKLGGKVLTYGGLAAVGVLAYKAYNDWQNGQQAGTHASPMTLPNPSPETGFDPENDQDATGQDFRLALMRAVISAAQADGHIDQDEHRHIRDQILELGLDTEDKAALFEYFSMPADPAVIAGLARTEAQRAELYLASALSIDPDTPEEVRYLDQLAREMRLNPGLRGHLEAEAEAARRQVA